MAGLAVAILLLLFFLSFLFNMCGNGNYRVSWMVNCAQTSRMRKLLLVQCEYKCIRIYILYIFIEMEAEWWNCCINEKHRVGQQRYTQVPATIDVMCWAVRARAQVSLWIFFGSNDNFNEPKNGYENEHPRITTLSQTQTHKKTVRVMHSL